jgi:REP element-mobilizing transposase RayT
MPDQPLALFITFTTYGAWLHGKSPGSVDVDHNEVGTPFLAPDADEERQERLSMSHAPYSLDEPRRQIALATIREVCAHRGWELLVCHVRTTHVHCIVVASATPEKIMNDFKAYASRRLTEAGFEDKNRKRWTRHGSTKYIWDEDYLRNAINYVLNRQGERMQWYCATQFEFLVANALSESRAHPSEPRASASG